MLRTPLVMTAAMAMIAFSPGAASAGQDPIGDLLGQLQQTTGQLSGQITLPSPQPDDSTPKLPLPEAAPSESAPAQDSADRTAAKSVDLIIGGQKVATAGSSDAAVNDDDSASADSTLLGVGGQEILGAHADSTQTGSDHFGDFLAPLCDASTGALCLEILYADADASDDGSTSQAQSRTGLLNACLGGTSTDSEDPCTGPVRLELITSDSDANRDQDSGRTTGDTLSKIAGVCLQPDPVSGYCALDAAVITSQGSADSAAAQPTDGSSSLLRLASDGTELVSLTQPSDSYTGECATPELACATANESESSSDDGTASHRQQASSLMAVPMLQGGVLAGAAQTDTQVSSAGDTSSAVDDNADPGDSDAGDNNAVNAANTQSTDTAQNASAATGVLPNTGGVWSGLLALGLLLLAAGAFSTAFGRRGSRA